MDATALEPSFYECRYCGKKMAKKDTFDKHKCDKFKRHEISKTKAGVNAFIDYKYWLSLNARAVYNLDTFINSRYFSSFVEFQKYIALKGIPDKRMYIRYMHELNISPMLWRMQSVYEKFIEYFDVAVSPLDKVNITITTLSKLARILACDISDVFDGLFPSEIARLIYERRLSPWLLLMSPRFARYLHMVPDPSKYITIRTLIDPDEWHLKLKENPEILADIKKIVTAYKL